jgi:protease I
MIPPHCPSPGGETSIMGRHTTPAEEGANVAEVVMVIAPSIFRDEEYAEPKRVLEARGAHVVTASVMPGECVGKLGMRAFAEISVADAADTDWDAVVFVGGAGASVYFDDAAAHELARQTVACEHVLSAICIAPSTLAHAGLLDGVSATAFASQEDDLVAHGARWTGNRVTRDGLILTANGPEAAREFGQTLADMLGLPKA